MDIKAFFQKHKAEWFKVSEDELRHREELNEKYTIGPLQKAAMVLERAIDIVVSQLGVDTTRSAEDVSIDMKLLGIEIKTLKDYPGMFVMLTNVSPPIAYAWISDAMLDSSGEYNFQIHWFTKNKMDEVKGEKIIQ